MVSRRTPACQYGSRAELAIIEARQLAPIEASSPDGAIRLLWQAMQFSECENSERSGFAFGVPVLVGSSLALTKTIDTSQSVSASRKILP